LSDLDIVCLNNQYVVEVAWVKSVITVGPQLTLVVWRNPMEDMTYIVKHVETNGI